MTILTELGALITGLITRVLVVPAQGTGARAVRRADWSGGEMRRTHRFGAGG